MRNLLLGAVCAGSVAFSGAFAFAETTIRVTLQLPKTHLLGQNWLAFQKLIEEKATVDAVRDKMNVVDLSADERAQWVAATAGIVDRFKKEAGATGVAAVAAVKAAASK